MSARDAMSAGELYRPDDPELAALAATALALVEDYNAAGRDGAARDAILARLLGSRGAGTVIRPPFYVDYGFNIHLGANVFLNFGCVLLDICPIRVGDGTQIGPMCQLLAADHPRDPEVRHAGLENGRPVTIGRNCWIGGGVLILPGVSVGDDAIIGAGAVVTRDVPAGATVVGNPARPLPARPSGGPAGSAP